MTLGTATVTIIPDPLRPSRDELAGRQVRIYRNLHNGLWSMQAKVPAGKNGRMEWRVVEHTTGLVLKDAKFIVSEAGRQRVIAEKCKNVHAYVVGTLLDTPAWDVRVDNATIVTYNPYHLGSFVAGFAREPLVEAELVVFRDGKVFVGSKLTEKTIWSLS